jgi:hypothetical protein
VAILVLVAIFPATAFKTNCAVYLDVDPSLSYVVAIEAISTIQKTQVMVVVLLTPGTKKASVR